MDIEPLKLSIKSSRRWQESFETTAGYTLFDEKMPKSHLLNARINYYDDLPCWFVSRMTYLPEDLDMLLFWAALSAGHTSFFRVEDHIGEGRMKREKHLIHIAFTDGSPYQEQARKALVEMGYTLDMTPATEEDSLKGTDINPLPKNYFTNHGHPGEEVRPVVGHNAKELRDRLTRVTLGGYK